MFKFVKTIDQNFQSKINKSIVFNYLRDNQPVSRATIAKELKISPSAVTRLVGDLIQKGYILEFEKEITSVGKRPTLLKINSELGCVVSLDLSQSYLKIAVNNFSCVVIEEFDSFKITNDSKIIDKIISELRNILGKYSTKNKLKYKNLEVKAISLGIPADLDITTGEIKSASLYDKWYSINFKTVLEKEFKIPVFTEKDVYLSVFAEKHRGEGKFFSDIVFVEISIGVSSGIIIDNNILRGNSLSAGQISFMVFDGELYDYKDGDIGFLDKHASFQSFRENFIKKINHGEKSIALNTVNQDLNNITTNIIFDAAYKGDKVASDTIVEIADLLSKAIVNLILIVNPQIIILGGNITNCHGVEEIFISRINEKVKRALPVQAPIIALSKLKEDVVLVGASIFAVDAMLYDVFPYKV